MLFNDNNNSVIRASGPLLLQVGSQSALTIDTSRNSAFAGNLDVAGTITGDDGLSIQGGAGNAYLQVGSNTGSWTWKNYQSTHKLALEDSDGTGEVLNFSTAGAATFAGAITSSGNIKTTGLLEVASAQPRILLDRNDGSYSWNIYNGDGTGNFPLSTFNIANNAGTAVITALDNGNVGIGTTSISTWAKLQVLGTAGAQTGANQALYIQSPTATANEGVGIRMSAASGSHEAVGIIGMVNNPSGNAGSMTFHTYNLGATIPEVMRITNTGNVGIGETNPTRRLVIKAPNGTTNSIQFQTPASGAAAGDGFGVGYDSNGKGFMWNYEGNQTYIGGAGGTTIVFANDMTIGIKATQDQKIGKSRVNVGGVLVNEGRYSNGKIGGSTFTSTSNSWNFHSSSSSTGGYTTIRFTVPDCGGTAGNGYGSFNAIMQVAGYNGNHCFANFAGYQNQGVYGPRANIIDSLGGSWTASIGNNGSHGWYMQLVTSGVTLTHPSAQIILCHGGATTTAAIYDLNDCTWTWS
jgi:hypothetical protein